jgi:hypothetical protein
MRLPVVLWLLLRATLWPLILEKIQSEFCFLFLKFKVLLFIDAQRVPILP